jgi:hypothetical protein
MHILHLFSQRRKGLIKPFLIQSFLIKRKDHKGEHIFALWANTRGATYGCSTFGAPLLDATQ